MGCCRDVLRRILINNYVVCIGLGLEGGLGGARGAKPSWGETRLFGRAGGRGDDGLYFVSKLCNVLGDVWKIGSEKRHELRCKGWIEDWITIFGRPCCYLNHLILELCTKVGHLRLGTRDKGSVWTGRA